MNSQHSFETITNKFDDFLKSRRRRCTVERTAILKSAFEFKQPFTAEELRAAVSERYPITTPTIYSTLELLQEAGLVRKSYTMANIGYYEPVTSVSRHVTLTCRQCGKVKRLKDSELTRVVEKRRFAGFVVEDFAINIFGLCRQCAAARNKL